MERPVKLTLENAPGNSLDLPHGATQVGTVFITEGGRLNVLFDPVFVRLFSAEELDGVIVSIGQYLRAIHGQGLPQ